MTPALRIMREGEVSQVDGRAALDRAHYLAGLVQNLLNICESALLDLDKAGRGATAAGHRGRIEALMRKHEKEGR